MKKVMIFGTFDILHTGHFYVFREAKKLGNYLVAIVARDARVSTIKKRKPIHTELERKKMLLHINLIDRVKLGDKTDVYKGIKQEKPDLIVLGYDQRQFTEKLEQKITEFKLKTKIKRLKPYKHTHLKSGIIRKELEKHL